MIKTLKVWLKKSQLTKAHNDYSAHVLEKGSMDVENIIDELLNEGLDINRKTALDFITSFNQKTSDLALTGYNVNTGLVNIRPIIKGSLYGGKWNSYINSVSVAITESYDLRHAIAETKVEIVGENGDSVKTDSVTDQNSQNTENKFLNDRSTELRGSNLKNHGDNSACGIAFHTWLFKA